MSRIIYMKTTTTNLTNSNLSRIGKRLPLHKRAFFMFIYSLSILLTSTAFVDTNAKYGIPLSRYTVSFENCP